MSSTMSSKINSDDVISELKAKLEFACTMLRIPVENLTVLFNTAKADKGNKPKRIKNTHSGKWAITFPFTKLWFCSPTPDTFELLSLNLHAYVLLLSTSLWVGVNWSNVHLV